MDQKIKCVFVGDSTVGKTSVIFTSYFKIFPDENCAWKIHCSDDNFLQKLQFDGKSFHLQLWDSAGGEEYDRLRPLSYPGTDVFVLCFSLVDPGSFENVRVRWNPELQHHCPKTPVLLMGTKSDLRTDPLTMEKLKEKNLEPITKDEGQRMAREIGAVEYLETSALRLEGVETLGVDLVRAALCRVKSKSVCKTQ